MKDEYNDIIALLNRASSFKISEVKCFKYDEDRGEDYVEYPIDSYAAFNAFRDLLLEATESLRQYRNQTNNIKDIISERDQYKARLESLQAKIGVLSA